MSANASGAAKGNGEARNRDHNQGNQDRKYTIEQKQAVLRVRRCSPTAFYEILDLEAVKATVTESEIKKAYRKLSLLTHPDKNGHEHADEAFKMVSRAFGVLGDKEKKEKYDKYGGDPDSRFGGGASAQQSDPFAGFARRQAGGMPRGQPFEADMTPEEMFARFFGGGGMNGFGDGGMFGGGPQFVFNMGGGPGIRVHQFGGPRPRRRPREAGQQEPQPTLWSMFTGLLPLLILFILPLLSSLFSGSETVPKGPSVRFNGPEPPHTMHRTSRIYNVDYWVNPDEVSDYSARKFNQLDGRAEQMFTQALRVDCEREVNVRQRVIDEAQGWFFQDPDKMQQARKMEMKACKKLQTMGLMPRGSF